MQLNIRQIENPPTALDMRRAMALVLYSPPGEVDLAGVNAILAEIADDNRITQALLALAHFAHTQRPELRTPQYADALRATINDLRMEELKQ
jgi:hypothetical protein